MNATEFPREVRQALETAWSPEAAAINMERWLTLCSREGWGACPQNLSLLTLLFGASWYFTRLVFYRGIEVARHVDAPALTDYSTGVIYSVLAQNNHTLDLEQGFDRLRLAKNEFMLRIFLSFLKQEINQAQMEQALTNLADASLQCAMELLWKGEERSMQQIAILAMGRMAGGEMNFGSDLDLIFLYAENTGSDAAGLMRQIRMLLRHIASPAPSGILYEIDMRLRPHGTSGTLISPVHYFIEYHSGQREIWERQMMTRCRPVFDLQALAQQALAVITPFIYASHAPDVLQSEILSMRGKVQHELGSPKEKYELKRGCGGIMDIDFLTHFLQLRHGHENPALRTPSTRNALQVLNQSWIITAVQLHELQHAYDFLKRLEGVLRIADLKNVSAFSTHVQDANNQRLARAMGFFDHDRKAAVEKFIQEYLNITRKVRKHFTALVGKIEGSGFEG